MENRKKFCRRCITLMIWSLGAVLLQKVWSYQKSLSDPLGAYIQFAVMFLATFYVLAFFPIKNCLDRLFSRLGSFSTEASENSSKPE